MSSFVVREAFEDALRVRYPATELVPINNVNPVYPKDTNGKLKAFLGVLYFGNEQPLGIGNSCWRETGTINLLIYALAGRGDPAATADELRRLFRGRDLRVSPPGVRLALLGADPLTSYLGHSGAASGAYNVGMVAIPYEFDYTG